MPFTFSISFFLKIIVASFGEAEAAQIAGEGKRRVRAKFWGGSPSTTEQ